MIPSRIDIKAARKLAGEVDGISVKDWNQVLDELETAQNEAEHSEGLARYYHGKLDERDKRIIQLKEAVLKAKKDGLEKGYGDGAADQTR